MKECKNPSCSESVDDKRKFCSRACYRSYQPIMLAERNRSQKMREIGREKGLTNNPAKKPEVKAKMSVAQKQRMARGDHPNIGKHPSKATKDKIAKTLRKGHASGRIVIATAGKTLGTAYRDNISKHHWTKNPKYQGVNHPWYRGGRKRDRQFNSLEAMCECSYSTLFTSELKIEIWKRDDFTCQICGKRGGVLHCHHIDFNKWHTARDNLLTLCPSCHGKTTSKPKYWKNQLVKVHRIYSMVIGRFQVPEPHAGHRALIDSVLAEGKNVLVSIRLDDNTLKNPFSWWERIMAFEQIYKEEILQGRVIVMPIPDIEEVVYGRGVGWGTREVHLDKETESISGTSIREGTK